MNGSDQLESALIEGKFDQNVLQSLSVITETIKRSRTFVEALLARHTTANVTPEVAVSNTMWTLEVLADKSKPIGCILMLHLYGFADALYLHDVCDSIDLWVSHCSSPELNQHLRMLAGAEPDRNMRRHYEQLVK